jgi:hypothetical protein
VGDPLVARRRHVEVPVSATLSSMDVDPPAPRDVPDHDQVVLLRNVSWEHYEPVLKIRTYRSPFLFRFTTPY